MQRISFQWKTFSTDVSDETLKKKSPSSFSFPISSAQRALTSLSCFAYNKVMEQNRGVHLQKATVINVKYAPEIDRKKQVRGNSR